MKRQVEKGGFENCNSRAFGFGELPLENNFAAHNILSHLNRGLKANYVHTDDATEVERVQDSLL